MKQKRPLNATWLRVYASSRVTRTVTACDSSSSRFICPMVGSSICSFSFWLEFRLASFEQMDWPSELFENRLSKRFEDRDGRPRVWLTLLSVFEKFCRFWFRFLRTTRFIRIRSNESTVQNAKLTLLRVICFFLPLFGGLYANPGFPRPNPVFAQLATVLILAELS